MYYERLMQVTGLTKQADFPFSGITPSMQNAGFGNYTKLSPVNMGATATKYNNARVGGALQSDGFATETNFNGGTPVAQEKQPVELRRPKATDLLVNTAKNIYSNARDAIFGIKYEPPIYDAIHGPTFTPSKPGTMTPTVHPALNVAPDIPGITDVPAPAPGAPAIDMRSITSQFGTTPQQLTQTQVTPTDAKLPFQQEPNILSDIAAMKVQQPQMPQSQPQPLQPQTQPQYGYTMKDLNKLTSADAAKYSKHFGRGGYNPNSINDRMALQMMRNGVNPNTSNFQKQLNQNLKTMGFNRTRNARRANQQLINLGFKRAQ